MKKILLIASLSISAHANHVSAQALQCNSVLQDRLVNTQSTSTSEVLISRMKSNICNRSFTSKQAVQEYMRSGGWELNVFDLFDNSLTDSKESSTGTYSIERTEFCGKSSADLARSFGSNYLDVNGRFVLEAFEHCVDATNADVLYMEYRLHDYGADQVITGELVRDPGPRPTSLSYKIEGFSVEPEDVEVSCKLLSQPIPDDLSETNPLQVTSSPANIACSKGADKTVTISIQTSEGSFSLVSPSNEEDERLAETRELETLVAEQSSEITSLDQQLSIADDAAASSRDLIETLTGQRDKFARRYHATALRVYTGDGGYLGGRDISAPCGTAMNEAYFVGQCAAKGLRYWSSIHVAGIAGGICGHNWYTLLCEAP